MNTQPARQFCFKCFIHFAGLTLAVVGSFAYLSFNPFKFFNSESISQLALYGSRFFPPDVHTAFLGKILKATFETIAISAIATLLATVISLLFAIPAAGKYGRRAKQVTRFFFNFLRSVPELVFATILVLAVGLGPFAGTLALTLHTTGVLGRLFGEALENHPTKAYDALLLNGSNAAQAFLYGTLPGVTAQFISYALYRWEMNIRMATILGFVGAGGLGQMLYYELSLLHEPQTASIIIAMLILIVLVDFISNKLRTLQRHNQG
jgi:phosphonate transport system permease protein